jgi:hypothetical protein
MAVFYFLGIPACALLTFCQKVLFCVYGLIHSLCAILQTILFCSMGYHD